MSNFWTDYPEIQLKLDKVRDIIIKNVKCKNNIMEEALVDLAYSGGKMLRPAFVILSGGFGDVDEKKLLSLAAVIEMLHMSTLIHDDIIDDAVIRRGSQTVQSKYGKDYAVFMGDYLFSKCFTLLSENTSMKNMNEVSKVISRICVGEIDQFSHKFVPVISVKSYLKRIAAKTAALFALSFNIGASVSGCDNKGVRNLSKIGFDIGMAFQIIDDILDFSGDEKLVGKPLGNDIKQGIFTLPLIYTFKNKDDFSEIDKKEFSDEDVERLIKMAEENKGIHKSKDLAQRYTKKAFNGINTLSDCNSKEIIFDVTQKLLLREY